MIQGEMEKSHWYTYSVHSKGGGKTTTWRSNKKFMIQGETENIGGWQAYSYSQEGGTDIQIEGYYFWGRMDRKTDGQTDKASLRWRTT